MEFKYTWMYTVELKPHAQKFVESQTKKVQRQLIKRMEALATNPHPQNSKLLYAKEKLYSLRSGNFRIIYQVQEKKLLIVVAKIGARKDIYRRLSN